MNKIVALLLYRTTDVDDNVALEKLETYQREDTLYIVASAHFIYYHNIKKVQNNRVVGHDGVLQLQRCIVHIFYSHVYTQYYNINLLTTRSLI